MSKQRKAQPEEGQEPETIERDADLQAVLDAEEALRRTDAGDLDALECAASAALRLHRRFNAAREAQKETLHKKHPAVKILRDFTVPGRFRVSAGKIYSKAKEPDQYAAIVRAGKVGETIEFVPAP